MAAAGCQLHQDLTQLAVMWLLRVLVNLHRFLELISRADRYFRHHRPDVVVLIDYPGFNWWIARRAKRHGIPVVYYGAPQLWAWASWRVRKMRQLVDHVICKLPFEVEWYRARDCQVTYLGHPYFDQLRQQRLDKVFLHDQQHRSGHLVTILPGSRAQEVKCNLRSLLASAEVVRQSVPNVRFAIAAFRPRHAEWARDLAAKMGIDLEVHVGKTGELIRAADCAMAVSGSVSLELLYHTTPAVIVYHVSRFAFLVQRFLRRVRYITLVNLLTAEDPFGSEVGVYDPDNPKDAHVLMPEYLTCRDRSREIASHIVEWLTVPASRERRVAQLTALKECVGQGGASARAAAYILRKLGSRPLRPLRTHFPFSSDCEHVYRPAA
jgi:lipid-A-disaccharide synthase